MSIDPKEVERIIWQHMPPSTPQDRADIAKVASAIVALFGGAGGGEVSAAARDVLAERRRQVEVEGWSPEHDDAHANGAMAAAAAAYAVHGQPWEAQVTGGASIGARWPWHLRWWKPKDRRRDLVRAGALILAEIERLDRASPPTPAPEREEEEPNVVPREIAEALQDSAFLAGVQAGWNLGLVEDNEGLAAIQQARSGYLATITERRRKERAPLPTPAPAGGREGAPVSTLREALKLAEREIVSRIRKGLDGAEFCTKEVAELVDTNPAIVAIRAALSNGGEDE